MDGLRPVRSGRHERSYTRRSDRAVHKDLPDYSIIDPEEIDQAIDVYVDAPVVKVDEIKFELDDLRAHLAVLAEAGHFVQLNVGAGVRLGKVELEIKGVETQALLEARLHNVTAILARVLTTLDRNPELLKSVGEALGDVGGGAHDLLSDTGDAVKSAGKGAESALRDVGRGAGKGVAGIGRGAEQGVEGLGQGAQQGVEGLGQGAQQGIQGVGQGAQQGVRGSAKVRSRASKGSARAPSKASRALVRVPSRGSRTSGRAAVVADGLQADTSQRSGSRRTQSGASRRRTAICLQPAAGEQNGDGLRPAQQARHEVNESDREYRKYVHEDEQDRVGPPDVLLDVPELASTRSTSSSTTSMRTWPSRRGC